jgi:hypothetical protein
MVKILAGDPARTRIGKRLAEDIGCPIKGMGAKTRLCRTQLRLVRNRAASQIFQEAEGCHVSPCAGQIEYKMRGRN